MAKITKVMRYQIIKPIDEDWSSLGKALNEIEYGAWKISNKTIQLTWNYRNFAYSYEQRFGEKLKFEALGTGVKTQTSDIYKKMREEYPNISSDSINAIIRNSQSRFDAEYKEFLYGKKSLPSYKKGTPFPLKGANINVNNEDSNYFIDFTLLSRIGKKNLEIPARYKVMVKTDNSSKQILNRIINNEYKLCESQLLKRKGKWFINISYQFESIEKELDENNIMGIDMGIVYPVYMAFNNSLSRYKIEGGEIEQFRRNLEARRISMLKQGKYCGDGRRGHGIKTRIKPIEKLSSKVDNFKNTTNHKYSKFVVDTAVKHGCGTIQMEDLTGIADGDNKSTFLGRWTYYDLQTKIEYKAKEKGIKVVKVNPKHTSQRCSGCGFIDKSNRVNQSTFKCKCGYEVNADFNASRNIATKDISRIIKEQIIKQEKEFKNNMKYMAE